MLPHVQGLPSRMGWVQQPAWPNQSVWVLPLDQLAVALEVLAIEAFALEACAIGSERQSEVVDSSYLSCARPGCPTL